MQDRRWLILVAAVVLAVAACGGGDDGGGTTEAPSGGGGGAGDAVAGAEVYSQTCAACHGADLAGIDGLGKPLAPSDFVAANSEAELAEFIAVGRPAGDPDNMQGVDMPPKGGNPALSDQGLRDVAAYLKAQQ